MSWALVNRGLELFDCDLPESSSQNKESKPHTRRHGFKRNSTKKQLAQIREKEAKQQLIQKKVASAFENKKKYVAVDKTRYNLRLLQRIDKAKAGEKITAQIKEQLSKELDKKSFNLDAHKRNKKPEEKSVFTDEDFDRVNEDWLRLY